MAAKLAVARAEVGAEVSVAELDEGVLDEDEPIVC